ncbi:MAG: sporulation protein YunB [Eubacteriales bacterium]|nr:sporulation protein YunB [Eubacteriales bacterium]
MYRKPHRRKLKFILIKLALLVLIPSIALFCLFEFKARDLVHNLVDNELEIHAVNSIDTAVGEILDNSDIEYTDLIVVSKSEDGSISSLSTNTKEVNKLKADMSLKITEYIKNNKKVTAKVPAGAFTGIVLLSNVGPKIPVSLTLGGSVTTTIKSDFTSAGINQTVHRIYLVVDADISLTCPIINYESNVVTEYELCQTVIVGSTPNVFANIG